MKRAQVTVPQRNTRRRVQSLETHMQTIFNFEASVLDLGPIATYNPVTIILPLMSMCPVTVQFNANGLTIHWTDICPGCICVNDEMLCVRQSGMASEYLEALTASPSIESHQVQFITYAIQCLVGNVLDAYKMKKRKKKNVVNVLSLINLFDQLAMSRS